MYMEVVYSIGCSLILNLKKKFKKKILMSGLYFQSIKSESLEVRFRH